MLAGLGKDELTAILTYHVVSGAAVRSSALKDGQVVTTLNGSPALVRTTGGVTIDDARVTAADVTASNGVIHVIDRIILPPEDDIVETALAAGSFDTLAAAINAAGLVDDSKQGAVRVCATERSQKSSMTDGGRASGRLLYKSVVRRGSGDSRRQRADAAQEESQSRIITGGVTNNQASVAPGDICAEKRGA